MDNQMTSNLSPERPRSEPHGWIPCSVNILPEFATKVLITHQVNAEAMIVREAERQPYSSRNWDCWGWFYGNGYSANPEDVTAWQPLPAPFSAADLPNTQGEQAGISICPRCEGTGSYNSKRCSICEGSGRIGPEGLAYKPEAAPDLLSAEQWLHDTFQTVPSNDGKPAVLLQQVNNFAGRLHYKFVTKAGELWEIEQMLEAYARAALSRGNCKEEK